MLARAMRKWDWEGAAVPEACDFGEFILQVGGAGVGGGWDRMAWGAESLDACVLMAGPELPSPRTLLGHPPAPARQCGLARLPDNPVLLITYANFFVEVRAGDEEGTRRRGPSCMPAARQLRHRSLRVAPHIRPSNPCALRPACRPPPRQARHDGQCARTQLQLAAKAGLGAVERFYHFKTQVGAGAGGDTATGGIGRQRFCSHLLLRDARRPCLLTPRHASSPASHCLTRLSPLPCNPPRTWPRS
jgi:hypothetical protein